MESLSSTDRKHMRLVCKDWFAACSAFEKKEKLCIGRLYNDQLDDVIATLLKSNRQYFNLEFYGIDFKRKPRVVFWRICGPRISSLKLFDCKISSPPFANILKFCSTIEILEFHFYSLKNMFNGLRVTYPTQIIPNDLQNQSLQTLQIHFTINTKYHRTPFLLLCHLLHFFPNITKFSFCHHDIFSSHPFLRPLFEKVMDPEEIQTTLINYFSRNQMKNVAVNLPSYALLKWDNLATVSELTA